MQLGLDPIRQTELRGKKKAATVADIAEQSWSFLRQKVSWSELNDWSHRLADWRLLLAYTRSQLRSRSGRITVLWEMASLVLVSVAS